MELKKYPLNEIHRSNKVCHKNIHLKNIDSHDFMKNLFETFKNQVNFLVLAM